MIVPRTLSRVPVRLPLFAIFTLLAALSLTGCGGLQLGDLLGRGAGSSGQPVQLSPLDEAKNALAAGQYGRAEALTQRLLKENKDTPRDTAEAARILAVAASRNKHPHLSLTALEQWRQAAPGVDNEKEWHDTWCAAVNQLPPREGRTRADALYKDADRSFTVRSVAGIYLAVRQWESGELGESLPALEHMYAAAQNYQTKALLEGRLAAQLHQANPAAINLAMGQVTPENQRVFPYNLVLIAQLRRQALSPANREEAVAQLANLEKNVDLADRSLVSAPPTLISYAPVESGPINGHPVVLALPLSGKYGNIAAKIAAGAEVACKQMSASGNAVSLVVINTDQPDWINRLEGLPKNAAVVGGPLRREDYATLKTQDLLSRRAFLTFLPSLDPGDEGRKAWRFFSSASDQVDALLAFTSSLGISGYAAFYPDEEYGNRMATLFESKAYNFGAKSVHKASYAPNAPTAWLHAVGTLLAANKNPEHAGGATFRAIFLPDSWRHMDIIVPNIFYYNETRQMLLGTSLWEQGLNSKTFVSPQYYSLAVFPGAWNGAQPSPAAEKLQSGLLAAGKGQADFWTGLGYDFARLSAGMSISSGWSAGDVNSALQRTSISWSMAPLRWSPAGEVSQAMFLFTPSEKGFSPLNEAEFRKNFAAAWK